MTLYQDIIAESAKWLANFTVVGGITPTTGSTVRTSGVSKPPAGTTKFTMADGDFDSEFELPVPQTIGSRFDFRNNATLTTTLRLTNTDLKQVIAIPTGKSIHFVSGYNDLGVLVWHWTKAPYLLSSEVSQFSVGLGIIVGFPGASVPDDGWLPMSPNTYNFTDYPDLEPLIKGGTIQITSAFTATTFTLKNLNTGADGGTGYFLGGLGGNAAGSLRADSTAVNGLRDLGHSHGIPTRSEESSSGALTPGGGGDSGTYSTNNATANLNSTDTVTAPFHMSVLWCVRAKPIPVTLGAGASLTINNQPIKHTVTYNSATVGVAHEFGWTFVRLPKTAGKQLDTVLASTGSTNAFVADSINYIVAIIAPPGGGTTNLTITESNSTTFKAVSYTVSPTTRNSIVMPLDAAVIWGQSVFNVNQRNFTDAKVRRAHAGTADIGVVCPDAGYVNIDTLIYVMSNHGRWNLEHYDTSSNLIKTYTPFIHVFPTTGGGEVARTISRLKVGSGDYFVLRNRGTNQTIWAEAELTEIRITYNPDIEYALPVATVVATPRTLTLVGGTFLDGSTTATIFEGSTFSYAVVSATANRRLTNATAPGLTLSVNRPTSQVTGSIPIGHGADVTVTATFAQATIPVSGNANINGVTTANLEIGVANPAIIRLPANNRMSGFTCINAVVNAFTPDGSVNITPDGAGNVVFTATFVSDLTVEYLYARVSTSTWTANTNVSYSNVQGNLPVSGADITLKANKIYKLKAFLQGTTGTGFGNYFWQNAGTLLPGSTEGWAISATATDASSAVPAVGVITVGNADITVQLRLGSNTTSFSGLASNRSSIIIEQIGASVPGVPAPAPTPVTATLTTGTFASTGTATRQFQENGGSGVINIPANNTLGNLVANAGVTTQFSTAGGFSVIVPAGVTAFTLTPTFTPNPVTPPTNPSEIFFVTGSAVAASNTQWQCAPFAVDSETEADMYAAFLFQKYVATALGSENDDTGDSMFGSTAIVGLANQIKAANTRFANVTFSGADVDVSTNGSVPVEWYSMLVAYNRTTNVGYFINVMHSTSQYAYVNNTRSNVAPGTGAPNPLCYSLPANTAVNFTDQGRLLVPIGINPGTLTVQQIIQAAPTPVTATLTTGTFVSTGTATRQFQDTGGSGAITVPAGNFLSNLTTTTAGVTIQFTNSGGFTVSYAAGITAFNLTPTFLVANQIRTWLANFQVTGAITPTSGGVVRTGGISRPPVGTSRFVMNDGEWDGELELPTPHPIGGRFDFRNNATLTTTIRTANTDLPQNISVPSGRSIHFVSGHSDTGTLIWHWIAAPFILTEAAALRSWRGSGDAGSRVGPAWATINMSIPAGGNRSMFLSAQTGTVTLDCMESYEGAGWSSATTITVDTNGARVRDYNLGSAADIQRVLVRDITNSRAYSMWVRIGANYAGNWFFIHEIGF